MRFTGPPSAAMMVVDSLPWKSCPGDASISTLPRRVAELLCVRAVQFAPDAFNCAFFDVARDTPKFAEVLDSLCAAGVYFEPGGTLNSLCHNAEHVAALLGSGPPELTITLAELFSLPALAQPSLAFHPPVE